jgi:hypothetical protein
MKVRTGYIPTEITYIFAGTQKVCQVWDDVDQPEHERNYAEVVPAFCSDADKEKGVETGKRWASSRCTHWDHETKKQVQTAQVGIKTMENKPISGLRVLSLEHRGQGGRAYKVVTPDGFYFDLREDILLDTMKTEGVTPGGILNGEYIWARVGAEMKLVRKGSELFRALLEASERSILSAIPLKQLKVGTVYETKSGERGLFLGFVDFWDYKLTWPNGEDTYFNRRQFLRANQRKNSINLDLPTVTCAFRKKQMLWFTISHWMYVNEKQDPTQRLLNDSLAETELSYHYNLKKSHSMVKKALDGIVVPANIVEQLRAKSEYTFEINRAKRAAEIASGKKHGWKHEWLEVEDSATRAMRMVTLRLSGAPDPVVTNATLLDIQSKLGQTLPGPIGL